MELVNKYITKHISNKLKEETRLDNNAGYYKVYNQTLYNNITPRLINTIQGLLNTTRLIFVLKITLQRHLYDTLGMLGPNGRIIRNK